MKKGTIAEIMTKILLEETVRTVADILKTNVGSSIDVGEYDWNLYKELNEIIYKLDPQKFMRHRSPTLDKQLFELEPGIAYSIKLPRKFGVWLSVTSYKTESKLFPPERRICIKFHGKEKHRYRNKIIQKLLRASKGDETVVEYMENDVSIKCKLTPTKLDNIILRDDIQVQILFSINNWKTSSKWYADHGLIHKLGILLYGKPGTGKSTIVRAISSLCGNAPILTVSPQNIPKSISEIIAKRNRVYGTIIVLIEDFDMFCKKRTDDGEDDELQKERNQANQNALFQLLDGVYSTENTIYVATTNHIDKLDPALVRYGRFDVQIELPYFEEEDCVKFVQKFGYDQSILNDMKLQYPVCPAYLQSEIMRIRSLKITED